MRIKMTENVGQQGQSLSQGQEYDLEPVAASQLVRKGLAFTVNPNEKLADAPPATLDGPVSVPAEHLDTIQPKVALPSSLNVIPIARPATEPFTDTVIPAAGQTVPVVPAVTPPGQVAASVQANPDGTITARQPARHARPTPASPATAKRAKPGTPADPAGTTNPAPAKDGANDGGGNAHNSENQGQDAPKP